MKKSISLLFISLFLITACSSDDSSPTIPETDPLIGWNKIQDLSTDLYTVELYSQQKKLQVGSNPVVVKLKPKSNSDNKNITSANWKTTMHMGNMTHGAPVLDLKAYQNYADLFEGNLFFQMAGDDHGDFWDLTIQFEHQNQKLTVSNQIEVIASKHQTIQSFEGSDENHYIIALLNPTTPKIGINDISAVVFKMESMDRFTLVNKYKVGIDPRMPSMQNHSSPNNTDLTQSLADKLYHGKLSLTMTGFWKINLQLFDASNNLIKGEAITETNGSSSLFFELEF
ncbi:hypothetical protein [Flavobacterium sp. NKUCC04_CG]|uniref:hypothetical protein n=1 Tax=Flavobacterium sp. NKUCC04_CG TaxID=2842121 RepID=UPI001C5BC0DB|nr:hypothetical protein [Flavobacterium sp. NKUCC04_CG]MBW3520244.1 hypothetical protein [Flavobacterium sp. NKUCC04_CG]